MSRHRESHASRTVLSVRSLGTILSFVALLMAAFAALVLIVVPLLSGSQPYSVLTNSMKPFYGPGTMLVVKPTPFTKLKVGDVVTYQLVSGHPEVITHRIVSIAADQDGNRMLITKGDNNDVADEKPVAEVQIRGKLLYGVPYAGFAANWLGNQDRGLLVKFVAAGLIAYGLTMMVRGSNMRRRSTQADASVESEEELTSA